MRQIKFRAWDKKEGCWIGGWALHPSGLWTDICGARMENGVCVAYANWKEIDTDKNIVIMQFTGLKDKNGKPIFEGDILRVDWNDSRYQPHNIGPVKWDEDEACWVLGEGGSPKNDAKNYMEVIGDIYSNPELLKGDTL